MRLATPRNSDSYGLKYIPIYAKSATGPNKKTTHNYEHFGIRSHQTFCLLTMQHDSAGKVQVVKLPMYIEQSQE
jgi:hypothetical protein